MKTSGSDISQTGILKRKNQGMYGKKGAST